MVPEAGDLFRDHHPNDVMQTPDSATVRSNSAVSAILKPAEQQPSLVPLLPPVPSIPPASKSGLFEAAKSKAIARAELEVERALNEVVERSSPADEKSETDVVPTQTSSDIQQQNIARALNTPVVQPSSDEVSARQALLTRLFDMGFFDRALNNSLLTKHKDDLSAVVSELLSRTDNDWHSNRH